MTAPEGITIRPSSILVDFRYRGTRCRETLKLKPTPQNIKHAARVRAAVVLEIERGTFDYLSHFPNSKLPAKHGWVARGDLTIEAGLKRWLEHRRGTMGQSCWNTYERVIRRQLVPAFGKYRVQDLTRDIVQDWVSSVQGKLRGKTLLNYLIPLNQFLDQCVADDLVHKNVAKLVSLPARDEHEPRPFTVEELQKIFAALPEGPWRNLFRFWSATGLRTGELIALKWENVNLTPGDATPLGSVFINAARTAEDGDKAPKTKAGVRHVRLFSPARESLDAQQQHTRFAAHGHVFANPETGEPFRTQQEIASIRDKAWKRALKRAGVEYRRPYELRHTFASVLLTAGEAPAWIARQLGHANAQVLFTVYARWMESNGVNPGERASSIFDQTTEKAA